MRKKILIFDENGFGRVCAALLELGGYIARHVSHYRDFDLGAEIEDIGLVITSFPYGSSVLESIREKDIPVLVLSDCLSDDLMQNLKKMTKSFCMVKPIDYDKFNHLVGQVLSGSPNIQGGYEIV